MITTRKSNTAYPVFPDKQYFTIGEAAALTLSRSHTLRYWEKRIPVLSKIGRRRGHRRCYSLDDVLVLRRVHRLLQQGYTLSGVHAVLTGVEAVSTENKKLSLRREIEQIMAML